MKNALKELLGIDIDYREVGKNVFCISIASKPYMHKEIDKIFNKNKIEYMKYFKNSSLYKSPLNKTLMSEISLYTEKVLGIVEKGINDNNIDEIFYLYKKSHRKIYNGIKSIKNIQVKDIAKNLSPGIESNYEFTATVYMFSLLNKPIQDVKALECMKIILDELLKLSYYDKTNFSKEKVNSHSKELKEIRDYLGIEKRSYSGEELINTIVKKDKERYNLSKTLVPWEMIPENDLYKIEKIGEVAKYIGAYEGLFKYLRINSAEMFCKVNFTPSEINTMLLNYIYSFKFNSFKDSDKNIFLISVIYLSVLNKVYSKLKDDYLKALNEDFLEEIDALQKGLEDSIYKAKKSEESFKEKETYFSKREQELLDRINQLEKENKRLKQEAKDNEPLKQEVIKLRNLVFEDFGVEDESLDDMDEIDIDSINIDELNNKKVIIFGGTTKWVNDMKEKLPNARFAGVECRNSKLDFVNKDSIVFINTKMSHAFYYKIKDVSQKLKLDYHYINRLANVKKSLVHMKNKISKE